MRYVVLFREDVANDDFNHGTPGCVEVGWWWDYGTPPGPRYYQWFLDIWLTRLTNACACVMYSLDVVVV